MVQGLLELLIVLVQSVLEINTTVESARVSHSPVLEPF